jgi:hypothetical protein
MFCPLMVRLAWSENKLDPSRLNPNSLVLCWVCKSYKKLSVQNIVKSCQCIYIRLYRLIIIQPLHLNG